MGLGADNNEQVDVNVLNLPYCTSNNSIAVGFQSDRDVIYLRKLLLEVMSKSRKELKEMLTDTVNTQTNDINKNNTRNYDRNDRNQRERDNRLFKQNERIAKSLEKDKEKGISKAAKSYIAAAIEFTLKAYNIALGPAMRLSNLFMDIESSGIFLKNGFDDLHESANRVGMSHEQMAALLKRTAPMLAKFNAAGKNGIQTLTKSMASIDSSLNLSNEEREAVVDATMNYIPAVRLANMSQQELNTRVNETARQLKMLAMATGKTVEQLKEEQDIKAKALRVKAYARSHPNQYKAMQAAKMSDDMIDYVASGGLRVTPEIMMSMAGPQNQFWRDLTNAFIRGNTGDRFGQAELGNFINTHKGDLITSYDYGERASSNQALYGVQSLSPLHENFAQGAANYYDIEELFKLGGVEGVLNNTSSGYKNSQKALERIYEAARNREKIGNDMEWLRGGGVEGVSEIAGFQASIYGKLSQLTEFLESFLGGTGLLSVITMAMAPFFARYIGDKVLRGILGVTSLSPKNIGRIINILAAGKGGLLAQTMSGSMGKALSFASKALPFAAAAAAIGGYVWSKKKEYDEKEEKIGKNAAADEAYLKYEELSESNNPFKVWWEFAKNPYELSKGFLRSFDMDELSEEDKKLFNARRVKKQYDDYSSNVKDKISALREEKAKYASLKVSASSEIERDKYESKENETDKKINDLLNKLVEVTESIRPQLDLLIHYEKNYDETSAAALMEKRLEGRPTSNV